MKQLSFKRIDFSILIPAVLLSGISLATLFSIDGALFRQQLAFLVVSLVCFFLVLNIDYRVFRLYSKFIYVGIIIGLFLVLIFGLRVNASKSWFFLFGVHLQISEFVKPFFIVVIAQFLSSSKLPTLLKYLGAWGLFLPVFILIMNQPDLGTALMYIMTLVGMLLMFKFPLKYYFISALLVIAPAPLVFQFLRDYQKERILTLFDLTADPFGSSYNAIQSLISIGSGGFFGKGLGQGTQSVLRFLPERHTDFIFASISENLGFMGGAVVICLFCFLLYRIYASSRYIQDEYSYLIVMGAFFLFLSQMVVNIGMNMGLMPIIGVTLPLMSYGGSSLITSFIMLGMVSAISYEYRKKHIFHIG